MVLRAISDAQNPPVLPESRIAWDIVKLIDYLLPKDTAEGRQLSGLQSRMLRQLLGCESNFQHEVISWALETAHCLDSILHINFTKLDHVVRTLDIHQLSPRTIQMLTQLPDYGDQSKAPAGLWQRWREYPLPNQSGTFIADAIKYGLCPRDEPAPTDIQDTCGSEVITINERRLVLFQLHRAGWQESFSILTPKFYPWRVAANERYIAACGTDTPSMTAKTGLFLWVWDASTRELVKRITCSSGTEVVLCGRSVAVLPLCDQECYLSIYNIPTGECEAVFLPQCIPILPVTSLSLAPSFVAIEFWLNQDQRMLLAFDRAATKRIFQLENVCSHTVRGSLLYTAKHDGKIQLWVRSGDTFEMIGPEIVTDAALSHLFCEGTIIGGVEKKKIIMWDLKTGKLTGSICIPTADVIYKLWCLPYGLLVSYRAAESGHCRLALFGDLSLPPEA